MTSFFNINQTQRGIILCLFAFYFYIIFNNVLVHLEYIVVLQKIIYYPAIYGTYCPVKPRFTEQTLWVFIIDTILKVIIYGSAIRFLGKKYFVYDVFITFICIDFIHCLFWPFPINIDFYYLSSRIFLLYDLLECSSLVGFLLVSLCFLIPVLVTEKLGIKKIGLYLLYAISSFAVQFLVLHVLLKVPLVYK